MSTTIFLGVLIVMLVLSVIGKLTMLVRWDFPQRTPVAEGLDIVINFALILWAVTILVSGSAS